VDVAVVNDTFRVSEGCIEVFGTGSFRGFLMSLAVAMREQD
jgi:hypothetical protein